MSNEIRHLIRRIRRSWLAGHPDEMRDALHPEVVMVFPGFEGRAVGADAMVAGFQDFCSHATILAYEESDHQVDVVGNAATASFRFEMTYERDGRRYRSTGRDLWVFARDRDLWKAVWRTMLDVRDEEV